MIKVNIQTLDAEREPIPVNLRGLDDSTLRDLQTALDPVPDEFLNIEYWPSSYTPSALSGNYVTGETLVADAATKTVVVTDVLTDYTAAELATQAAAGQEALIESLKAVIQGHLDTQAQNPAYDYDNMLSLSTYATSLTPRLAAEGLAGIVFRDACWNYGYTALAEVLAGTRSVPTADELLAELPVIVWPT